MIAGSTLNIDGKDVRCPAAPLYKCISNGVTLDIDESHYNVTCTFDRANGSDRELWKLDEKGAWHLLRKTFCGKEKQSDEQAVEPGVAAKDM
jgi:hypothetical protein